jgi:L-lactate dehydrogenase complex protein LldG
MLRVISRKVTMESRDLILGKLRKSFSGGEQAAIATTHGSEIFNDYPDQEVSAQLAQFTQRLTALKGEVYLAPSLKEAGNSLAELCRDAGVKAGIRYSSPLLDQLFDQSPDLTQTLTCPSCDLTPIEHAHFAQAQIGITTADALIARTGSVVLKASSAGGRRLSVLPPIHCVIAYQSQLVPSMDGWLKEINARNEWSYATVITGPSRTADIERILVLGAHGPKRLLVFIVSE